MNATCTYIKDVGDWPYTNPTRCGEVATAKLTHDGPEVPAELFDEAYTCAWHTPKIGIGAYWNKAEDIKPGVVT